MYVLAKAEDKCDNQRDGKMSREYADFESLLAIFRIKHQST